MSEEWEAIRSALEDRRFRWRTVRGVAKETDLTEEVIRKALDENAREIIRSSLPSQHGEALFTTRSHYRESATVWDRLSSAVQMKVR